MATWSAVVRKNLTPNPSPSQQLTKPVKLQPPKPVESTCYLCHCVLPMNPDGTFSCRFCGCEYTKCHDCKLLVTLRSLDDWICNWCGNHFCEDCWEQYDTSPAYFDGNWPCGTCNKKIK